MERAPWTYLIILGLSLLYPLAQSFEKRVYMHRKFRFIFPGILLTGAVYIIWDVWFTAAGVWGFNHNYTLDLYILGLPLEEWLFFLVVPYCCVFLYEVLRLFVKRFHHPVFARYTLIGLLVLFLGMIPFVTDRLYSLVTLSFTSLMLIIQLIMKTYRTWFSGFIITYLLAMVPFIVVNGALTSIPIVWYNNAENLGLRAYTVPLDDFIYLMGLLLPTIHVYNILLHRYASPALREKMKLHQVTGF